MSKIQKKFSLLLAFIMIINLCLPGISALAADANDGEYIIMGPGSNRPGKPGDNSSKTAEEIYDETDTFNHVDIRVDGDLVTENGNIALTIQHPRVQVIDSDGSTIASKEFTTTTSYEWRIMDIKVPKTASIYLTCDVYLNGELFKADCDFVFQGKEDFLIGIDTCDARQGLDFRITLEEIIEAISTDVSIETRVDENDLTVTVKDSEIDEIIENVKVVIKNENGEVVAEGTTDNNGNVVFEDLAPGDYVIDVEDLPFGYNPPENNPTITIEKQPVNVKTETTVNDEGNVTVKVTDPETNEPIPNVDVVVKDEDGNVVAEGTTNEDGEIVIEDLPSGDYTVEVEVPDGYNKPEDDSFTVEEPPVDTKTETEVTDNDAVIKVIDPETNEPVPGADVVIKDEDGNIVAEGTTNEDGELVVEDLIPGDYTVEVEVPEGYNKPEDDSFTVEEPPVDTELEAEVVGDGNDLTITVSDNETNAPIPNANVIIKSSDGEVVYEGTTDESGNISIENLNPDDYTIEVITVPEGYNLPEDTTVSIEENEVTPPIEDEKPNNPSDDELNSGEDNIPEDGKNPDEGNSDDDVTDENTPEDDTDIDEDDSDDEDNTPENGKNPDEENSDNHENVENVQTGDNIMNWFVTLIISGVMLFSTRKKEKKYID